MKTGSLLLCVALIGCGGSSGTDLFEGSEGAGGGTGDTGGAPGSGSGGRKGTGGRTSTAGGSSLDGGDNTGGAATGSGGARVGAGGGANTGGRAVLPDGGVAAGGRAEPLPDGATPPPLEGGLTGSIICGTKSCSIAGLPTTTCCIGTPPFPTDCFPSFPGCFVVAGYSIPCDDRTDCPAGELCCATFGGPTAGGACAKDCSAYAHQLCRIDDECSEGTCRETSGTQGFTTCR